MIIVRVESVSKIIALRLSHFLGRRTNREFWVSFIFFIKLLNNFAFFDSRWSLIRSYTIVNYECRLINVQMMLWRWLLSWSDRMTWRDKLWLWKRLLSNLLPFLLWLITIYLLNRLSVLNILVSMVSHLFSWRCYLLWILNWSLVLRYVAWRWNRWVVATFLKKSTSLSLRVL